MNNDNRYMQQVFQLALKGLGLVSPNPLVGALIVNKGRVLATGYHARFGADHAEIDALKKIKFKAEGATLYCNLEPCCHQGKTPPCVDQVIASGIKRVVIAQKDPNPRVNGRSIKILKKQGVEVVVGVCEKEARWLNRFFNTFHEKKRPYIVGKLAVSADFMFAPKEKKSKKPVWISNNKSRYLGHYWRTITDAILVGAQTVRDDMPNLLPRLKNNSAEILFLKTYFSKLKGSNPVLNFHELKLKKPLRFIATRRGESVSDWIKKELPHGPIQVVNNISKKHLREISRNYAITSLMIEGGMEVLQNLVNKNLIDEFILFRSSNNLGVPGRSAKKILKMVMKKDNRVLVRTKLAGDTLVSVSLVEG